MAQVRNGFAYQQTHSNAPLQPQQQSHHQLDTKRPAYLEDEELAVLDPTILDTDIMQSPTHHDLNFRKDSFAHSSGVLSPAESQQGWEAHHYPNALPIESASASLAGHFHDDHNGFVRHHSISHLPSYQPQHPPQAGWAIPQGSGHCTPSGNVELIPQPAAFDGYSHHRADSAHASFSHPPAPLFPVSHAEPAGFVQAPLPHTPMSPHSHTDWMNLAQQEAEGRPGPRRMRPHSPPRTSIEYQRRDGIRKKNGRIDIPQERNIHTIDDLIEKTKDEDTLKELKQQKRLLRNREAALASRQRKKKHTEDLEVKEKSFTTQISMLEQQVADLVLERDRFAHDITIVFQQKDEANRIIESMEEEKRHMQFTHNEETSQLRKQVQLLRAELEAGPAPAMSANPSSSGYNSEFNADMQSLSMGGSDEWDQFMFGPANDFNPANQYNPADDFLFEQHPMPTEPVKQSQVLEKKASSSTIVPSKKNTDNAIDQPIASGLLFMLLLCGAWVASKPAASSSPDLPISTEVRAAAPTVLSNLLAESGAPTSQQRHGAVQHQREPAPSHRAQASVRSNSGMDSLHQRIISPTKQQEFDAAFSLTTAQYASLTDPDYNVCSDVSANSSNKPRAHRNLAEAFADTQSDTSNKAAVYTRSLLFDQIDPDLIKQFKAMVRDREQLDTQDQIHAQQMRQPHRQQPVYKVEHQQQAHC